MDRRTFMAGGLAMSTGFYAQGARARRRLAWQQPIAAKQAERYVYTWKEVLSGVAAHARGEVSGLVVASDIQWPETLRLVTAGFGISCLPDAGLYPTSDLGTDAMFSVEADDITIDRVNVGLGSGAALFLKIVGDPIAGLTVSRCDLNLGASAAVISMTVNEFLWFSRFTDNYWAPSSGTLTMTLVGRQITVRGNAGATWDLTANSTNSAENIITGNFFNGGTVNTDGNPSGIFGGNVVACNTEIGSLTVDALDQSGFNT